MSQKIHRFVTDDFMVRFAAVDATEVVEKMRQTQSTFPLSTVALGRAMVGAVLMASHLKGDQEVSLDFKVSGPLQRVYAQAGLKGGVRGYVFNPAVSLQPGQNDLSLKDAMGKGLLTVTSFLPHQHTPHRGTVELYSGEVGEDLAQYFFQSLQIATLISLGVSLDGEGKVSAAGGVLVELMPGAEETIIKTLETNLKKLQGPSQALLDGLSPDHWVRQLAAPMRLRELDHPHEVHYSCPCTSGRVLRSLSLLETAEIEKAIKDEEVLTVQCQMCGTWYTAGPEELRDALEIKSRGSLH